MEFKPVATECKFTDEDHSKIQNLVSNIYSEFEDKKDTFIKDLIKERLSDLKITFENEVDFLEFVSKYLSATYNGVRHEIIYRNLPLLTYWYEMEERDLTKPNFTLTYNLYYL